MTRGRAKQLRHYIVKASASLANADALEAVELFPVWNAGVGYAADERLQYNGVLYRVVQAHTSQTGWEPDKTPALWTVIEVEHTGTQDDPIPYSGNMALEAGKYYSQGGVTYLCNRDTGNPVYHALSELVGLYVEVVNG